MKTMQLIKWVALLLTLTLLLLTACEPAQAPNGDGEESEEASSTAGIDSAESTEDTTTEEATTDAPPVGLVLASGGKSNYRIVFSESASTAIITAVNELVDAVKQTSGVKFSTSDDYRKDGVEDDPNACEILIGKTNRAASTAVLETLESGQYAACAVGSCLVVIGTSEATTIDAIEQLSVILTAKGSAELVFGEEDAFLLQGAKALRVSIMGDSISTYQGYSNSASYNPTLVEYPVWYTSAMRIKVTETWWHRVITEMGWELCVNNSYSGGRVTHPLTYETRAQNLHNVDGVKPDVILVYYGINDYNNMVSLTTFTEAYDAMLKKMIETYPEAKIYCCTLNPIICTDNGRNTSLEKNGAGVMLSAFNNAIIRVALENEADFIDLNGAIGSTLYQNTTDNIHPNKEGMRLMAEAVLENLKVDYSVK